MKEILFVFIGGGIGSISRYLGGKWINSFTHPAFPYATLFVNLLACLIIGMLAGTQIQKEFISPTIRYFLMIGFCGGFSTFSAFSFESVKLLQEGNITSFFIYVLVSVTGCILLTLGGIVLIQKVL